MKLAYPFEMNDWGIRPFLIVVLLLQSSMWALKGWQTIGIEVQPLRLILGIVCLNYIPGIVILRILRFHKLGTIRTSIYSVGLSISTVMFVGVVSNSTYPLFGLSHPISADLFLTTMSVLVVLLCIWSFIRDREFAEPRLVSFRSIVSLPTVFSVSLVLWTIAGTVIFNQSSRSEMLLLSLTAISAVVVAVSYKAIRREHYPILLLSISISLLYHSSLISNYLVGWDIEHEYYLSQLVVSHGIWNPDISFNTNGMLSIVMLAPVQSLICGIPLVWVFKIVYPMIISLVPIGLYCVMRKQVGERYAFLASFFFVSIYGFNTEIVQLGRQGIAELFVVILMMVFVESASLGSSRSLLMIIFGFSLIVSHYGLSFIFMFSLLCMWLILGRSLSKGTGVIRSPVSGAFVAIYFILALTWYSYVSGASSLLAFLDLAKSISSAAFSDLFNPTTSQGLAVVVSSAISPLHLIPKYMHLCAQMLILVGVVISLGRKGPNQMDRWYLVLAGYSLALMIAGIAVPYFAGSMNTSRIYQIGLIFLAPFLVIGAAMFCRLTRRLFTSSINPARSRSFFGAVSVFLAVLFLFNTGVIYQISGDHPTSISLNNRIDFPRFNEEEVLGAQWIVHVRGQDSVYSDSFRWLLIAGLDWRIASVFPANISQTPKDSYVFLGTLNIVDNKVLVPATRERLSSGIYIDSRNSFGDRNLICDIGGSRIVF